MLLNLVIMFHFLFVCFDGVPYEESVILHDFYNATNGDYWSPIKWDVNQIYSNPCGLRFVGCSSSVLEYIERISILPPNNLTGTIPSSISYLPKLLFLQISENRGVSGNIPENIFLLEDLNVLDLSSLTLTGTIPDVFYNMTQLDEVQ